MQLNSALSHVCVEVFRRVGRLQPLLSLLPLCFGRLVLVLVHLHIPSRRASLITISPFLVLVIIIVLIQVANAPELDGVVMGARRHEFLVIRHGYVLHGLACMLSYHPEELVGVYGDDADDAVLAARAHRVLVHLHQAFDALGVSDEAIAHVPPAAPGEDGEGAALCAAHHLAARLDDGEREELVLHLVRHGQELSAAPVPHGQVPVAACAEEGLVVVGEDHVRDEVLVLVELVHTPLLAEVPELDDAVVVAACEHGLLYHQQRADRRLVRLREDAGGAASSHVEGADARVCRAAEEGVAVCRKLQRAA
mmetsp:Transcript_2127/g.4996  ORF Transcript_2127/g.4996 Transcript_2127/m.4996 type:complete len:309 (+) Transcript_2127:29-955(+)